MMCSIFLDNNSCDYKTKDFELLIKSCYHFKDLMDFLDSWIFEVAFHKIFNKYVD